MSVFVDTNVLLRSVQPSHLRGVNYFRRSR
jgi:hypothetical protein